MRSNAERIIKSMGGNKYGEVIKRDLEGHTIEEDAAYFGVSSNLVKARRHRAYKIFRERFLYAYPDITK